VKKKLLVVFLISFTCIYFSQNSFAQAGAVKGTITDAETGETLIGTNIILQGSSIGTLSDFDGNYVLADVKPGEYNIVFSFISFEQQIVRVEVKPNETVTIKVAMKSVSTSLGEVEIKAERNKNTDASIISMTKLSSSVVNGISTQQISKSLDKNAAEVVKRIPGVTINDNRFIVVRGLIERYNTVWLNGVVAPSSETDVRAFSFDIIPSNQIENILVYKTPAPELPADFAGGAILISTKSTAYDDAMSVSYGTAFRQGTTFNSFQTYQGSPTDFLGFDNGTRALPANFPSTGQLNSYNDTGGKTPEQITADQNNATAAAQSYNKIWTPYTTNAIPDQAFVFDLSKRFLAGKVSIGNITAITYSNSQESDQINRAGYQTYYTQPDSLYNYMDNQYLQRNKVGVMFNWSFIFGKNQKIMFRNLFNQNGENITTLRTGHDLYNDTEISTYELGYQSRSVYSGQLAGEHTFGNSTNSLNWVFGYSYANKNQPDIRRVRYARPYGEVETPFRLTIYHDVNPDILGRINLSNDENIYVGGVNYIKRFFFDKWEPSLLAGIYLEYKNRDFNARNIGFTRATNQFDQSLQTQPIDTVFLDKNINYTTGITVQERTHLSDSYTATNHLNAAYIGLNLPIGKKVSIYGGVRLEKNIQTLDSYDITNQPVNYVNDTLNVFPSVNITYNITDKLLLRAAYGKTVNRPEFREIAPFAFYNFEENAVIYGNPGLVNAYINNYDFRVEWYPGIGDMLSLAGFYKEFQNPIEANLISSGTGWNYAFQNADYAKNTGIELEIRKSLLFLKGENGFVNFLKDISILFNTSLIKSTLKTSDPAARDSIRPMQGQSPYIVNAGLYYQNKQNWMVSILYNVLGERIAWVGDDNYANIVEMPRNVLDFNIQKLFVEKWKVSFGLRDALQSQVVFQNLKGDGSVGQDQVTKSYTPGRVFYLGLTFYF